MNYIKHAKRVATDAAGYFLIIAGVALGWLPGPGGIPLIIGGLGLLSINNEWAARLRDYMLQHGNEVLTKMFPTNKKVQLAYDIATVGTIALATFLLLRHAALWQVTLGSALIFAAIAVFLINRDRYKAFKRK